MKIVHDLGDGVHKLGRIILACISTIVVGWVLVNIPDITIDKLAMIISIPGLYIGIKGKGYVPSNPVTSDDFTD